MMRRPRWMHVLSWLALVVACVVSCASSDAPSDGGADSTVSALPPVDHRALGFNSPVLSGNPALIVGNGTTQGQFASSSSDYLQFGTTDATTGYLRFPNNATLLAARNAANSANVSIAAIDGSNNVTLGDGTNAALTQIVGNTGSALWGGDVNAAAFITARNGPYVQMHAATVYIDGDTINWRSSGDGQWATWTTNPTTGNNTWQLFSDVTSFTLDQASTSAATGANITIAPQASTASPGTGGSFVVNLPAPVGAGSEAYLTFERGGTNLGSIGPYPATANYLSIYAPNQTPGVNNYGFIVSSTLSIFNAPSGGQVFFRLNNTQAMGAYNGAGLQLFSETFSLGGGTNVLGIANASVVPTSNPSGGGVLYENSGALSHRSPNGIIEEVASTGSGSTDAQTQTFLRRSTVLKTTSSGATTLYSFATTSGTTASVHCRVSARCTVAGSTLVAGDGVFDEVAFAYKNVAGTLSQIGTSVVAVANVQDSHYSVSPATTVTTSGTNILVQVNQGTSTGTVDWQGLCTIDED